MTQLKKANIALLALAALSIGVVGCQPKKEAASDPSAIKKPTTQKPSRVAVKRGLDSDMKNVNMDPKDITVEELIAMKRPSGLADDISDDEWQSKRVEGLETQVWRLKCRVKSIVKRRDGDFFLVVQGKTGATTVVEVPDPGLCKGSAVEKQISSARTVLGDQYHPTDKSVDLDADATIEGVGFWGQLPKSGSKGAPNGARIMPGTNVQLAH